MELVIPHPQSIRASLDENTIGQAEAKMTLAVALFNHLKRITYDPAKSPVEEVTEFVKNNVLMIGPTGCGKTHMLKTLARIAGLPFNSADATKLVQAGYVGGQVEELFVPLIVQADYDLERAQRGMVLIDEIDKIRSNGSRGNGPDVNGEGVQRALLAILNGCKVTCKTPKGVFEFDTSNVFFIGAGAFAGLEKIIEKRKSGVSSIGFGGNIVSHEEDRAKLMELLLQVTTDDLLQFGLIGEFAGRFPMRTAVHQLSRDELRRILTEPKNSLVTQARALLGGNLDLQFPVATQQTIADEAYEQLTGARGLQEILSEVVTPITFMLPEGSVEVTPDMVTNRKLLASKAANTPAASGVEPCKITVAAPKPKEPSVSVFTQVWQRGDKTDYTRLLETTAGQGFYLLHRTVGCTCSCGTKTSIVWEGLVERQPGVDPIEAIKEPVARWFCDGCKSVRTAKYEPGREGLEHLNKAG